MSNTVKKRAQALRATALDHSAIVDIPSSPTLTLPVGNPETSATSSTSGPSGRERTTRSAAKRQQPNESTPPIPVQNVAPAARKPRKTKAEAAAAREEKARIKAAKDSAKATVAAEKAAKEHAKSKAKAADVQVQDRLEEAVREIEANNARVTAERNSQVVFMLSDVGTHTDPEISEDDCIPSTPSPIRRSEPATDILEDWRSESDDGAAVEDEDEDPESEDFQDESTSGVVDMPFNFDIENPRTVEEFKAVAEYWKAKAGIVEGTKKGSRAPKGSAPILASGLLPEFRRHRPPAPKATANLSVNIIGGLNDEDIEDTPPQPKTGETRCPPQAVPQAPIAGRNANRGNNLVVIVSQPEPVPADSKKSVTNPPRKAGVKVAPHPTRNPGINTVGTQVKASAPSLQANPTRDTKAKAKASKPKGGERQLKAKASNVSDTSQYSSSGDGRPLSTTTVRATDLPDFTHVDNKWKDIYLATLLHCAYGSVDPFGNFVRSSPILLAHVQNCVDVVYPEVDYVVKSQGDAILLLSYNRLCAFRASVASDARELVQSHVKDLKSVTEANQWLTWARRLDGPLFYKNATPAYCPTQRGDAHYIEPEGRLKSVFILELLKPFLAQSQSAVAVMGAPFQPPIGLVGLILAALQRAAQYVRPDGTVSPGTKEFSAKHFGEKVLKFIGTLRGVDLERWDEIFAICSAWGDEGDDVELNTDRSADIDEFDMFAFESPKKHR